MTKAALRADLLERRRALDPALAAAWSAAIARHVAAIPAYREAAAVLAYCAHDGEVDTRALIANALEAGRTVLVPISLGAGQMLWSRLRDPGQLAPGRYGIPEPPPAQRAIVEDAARIEGAVCLVPVVGFDARGHRIGYGAGYFDRFLEAFRGTAIGLAYAMQQCPAVPDAPHDRPLDWIATERGIQGQTANSGGAWPTPDARARYRRNS